MKRIAVLLLLAVLITGCAHSSPEATAPTEPTVAEMPASFQGLGSKMPEITISVAAGGTLKLSELLKEKDLVVLNFWYEDCPWCVREFPVLELAYQDYRQNVEILALNPVDGSQAVKNFQEGHSLTFPMASCPRSWATECGVSAYPTSIFIDRNGVVCLIHVGAITSDYAWERIFDAFTGDDYQSRTYTSVEQLLG